MRALARLVLTFAVLASLTIGHPISASAQAADFDTAGGRFFTQTGGGGGKGYAVTDDGAARFWSEFQRLGGVQAVGYPASQRFQWDGFTVQVFQRVVFQWRPESNSVAFVNVFDRLGELGKNEFLRTVRQTPPPRAFDDAGKAWEQVMANHLAVLERYPAVKAKYFAVVGDPIQANGLPMSDVTDMGDALVLRAQRVVLQQWKKDVPWAKAGEVTVALGGDIAKEAGVLPAPEALLATLPGGAQAAAPAPAAPSRSGPGTVLYQADWSTGNGGWPLSGSWKRLGNIVLNDGTDDRDGTSDIRAPYRPEVADYAVEAEIQYPEQPGYSRDTQIHQYFSLRLRDDYAARIFIDAVELARCSPRDPRCIVETETLKVAGFKHGNSWHKYRFEAKGNRLRFLIDDGVLLDVTDNRFLEPGSVGMSAILTQLQVRSFKVIAL